MLAAPSALPKDKREAALGIAIPTAFITLGSAFLYLTGYMFLAGFWNYLGVDLPLLGLSTGDVLTFSYFPNAHWAILATQAILVVGAVFILLSLNGSVRARIKRITDILPSVHRAIGVGLFSAAVIALPLVTNSYGKAGAKSFLLTAGTQNKVFVSFKTDLKQSDQHHVTLASNAGRLFLLAQTKDLVIVAETTGNSQIHTYTLSRSDLLSVELAFDASK